MVIISSMIGSRTITGGGDVGAGVVVDQSLMAMMMIKMFTSQVPQPRRGSGNLARCSLFTVFQKKLIWLSPLIIMIDIFIFVTFLYKHWYLHIHHWIGPGPVLLPRLHVSQDHQTLAPLWLSFNYKSVSYCSSLRHCISLPIQGPHGPWHGMALPSSILLLFNFHSALGHTWPHLATLGHTGHTWSLLATLAMLATFGHTGHAESKLRITTIHHKSNSGQLVQRTNIKQFTQQTNKGNAIHLQISVKVSWYRADVFLSITCSFLLLSSIIWRILYQSLGNEKPYTSWWFDDDDDDDGDDDDDDDDDDDAHFLMVWWLW